MIYGYGEHSGTFQVWLDAWNSDSSDESWPSDAHGVVCERHALSMSAPVGWNLIDRRESVPRLFVPRPVLVHSRSLDASEPVRDTATGRQAELASDSDEVSKLADERAALRRKRVTELPVPQLFADLHSEDRPTPEPLAVDEPPQETVVESPMSSRNSTPSDDDDGLSSLLDATGPLLRRAFGKRNTGRHDASKELMRPTTHRVVDESA